jgi:hypothetical protein
MDVRPLAWEEAKPWLLTKHYARRTAPVTYAFGVYEDGALLGVVTYGTPVSSSLRAGICGPEWADRVLELNRLCCESRKNLASLLVGRSLAMLPHPRVVVSYADTAMGHVGYVYQATNFLYTGLSAKRTDWKVRGQEHLHGATISDRTRGMANRAEAIRAMYGDDFYLQDRPRKHRYVYFVGTKNERQQMRGVLRYPVEPYPKGESQRYDAGGDLPTQMSLL